jgi:hypothetical protein
MMVIYDYDSNFIHVEPMKNRTKNEMLSAFQRAITLFKSRGLQPKLQKLDNEASGLLQDFMAAENIDYQLVPPGIHRRNAAERAIRTFKNHFIAGLCTTDPKFPLVLWDQLLPQTLITLNLLRSSRINPQLSAWAQVHGNFDYNRTPLAPPGTRVLVHGKPDLRGTWSPHCIEGWYLAPAMKHYRCYKVWIPETRATRIADTLAWFPTQVKMPIPDTATLAIATARDLVKILGNPNPASPLSPLSASEKESLEQLAKNFQNISSTTITPAASQIANDDNRRTPTDLLSPPPGFPTISSVPSPLPRVTPQPITDNGTIPALLRVRRSTRLSTIIESPVTDTKRPRRVQSKRQQQHSLKISLADNDKSNRKN